tara:strand:- start:162323 stop:162514 length:192 start_codon:yes stop_codon:yes gene_type:complete
MEGNKMASVSKVVNPATQAEANRLYRVAQAAKGAAAKGNKATIGRLKLSKLMAAGVIPVNARR